jgi:hypothetical protein
MNREGTRSLNSFYCYRLFSTNFRYVFGTMYLSIKMDFQFRRIVPRNNVRSDILHKTGILLFGSFLCTFLLL